MFDYRAALERRIAQFVSYLQPMNQRAHEIARGSCFMIFEEQRPAETSGAALAEERELVAQAVRSAFCELGSAGEATAGESFDLPDEGWRSNDSLHRFIQFSFERNWFCIDMPIQTLFRPEAEEILRYRQGFFYLAQRPEFRLYGEDVEGYYPFRKVYVYGDERSAAEDMAFVFFQAWKFPVDSRLYVSSAAFSGEYTWEEGLPID